MPRKTIRTRGTVPPEILKEASEKVRQGSSVRAVAKIYGICHVTLHRYCVRRKTLEDAGSKELPKSGYNSHLKVFSADQETTVMQYILQAADIFFGLCPREARRLAYQLAKHFNRKFPASWENAEMAGKDWLIGFMQRHPKLSLYRPQSAIISTEMTFKEHHFGLFLNNLQTVLKRYHLEGHHIWHMDEIEITVRTPQTDIVKKYVKQVEAITSTERERVVTMAIAVSATGNMIPPHFLFPRKRFLPHMINGGPPGCIGTANNSGLMQEEDFLVFLQHFVRHTGASSQSSVLMLLDNHPAHVTTRGIDFCRENGVILLSFHPQSSYRLQPLNQSVFGPLKTCINQQVDELMSAHSGTTMSIFDIPSLVAEALPRAASCSNITSGFKYTGIWPFDPTVFTASGVAPSVFNQPEDEEDTETGQSLDRDWAQKTFLCPVSVQAAPSVSSPGMPTNSVPLFTSAQAAACVLPPGVPPTSGYPSIPVRADGSIISPGLQPGCTPLQHNTAGSLLFSSVSSSPCPLLSPAPAADSLFFPGVCSSIGPLSSSSQSASSFHSSLVQPVFTNLSTVSGDSYYNIEAQEHNKTTQLALDIFTPVSICSPSKPGPRKTVTRERIRVPEILNQSPFKGDHEHPQYKPTKKMQNNTDKSVKTDAQKQCFCLVCGESLLSPRCEAMCVQCWSCRSWAHEDCTEGGKIYTCDKC